MSFEFFGASRCCMMRAEVREDIHEPIRAPTDADVMTSDGRMG